MMSRGKIAMVAVPVREALIRVRLRESLPSQTGTSISAAIPGLCRRQLPGSWVRNTSCRLTISWHAGLRGFNVLVPSQPQLLTWTLYKRTRAHSASRTTGDPGQRTSADVGSRRGSREHRRIGRLIPQKSHRPTVGVSKKLRQLNSTANPCRSVTSLALLKATARPDHKFFLRPPPYRVAHLRPNCRGPSPRFAPGFLLSLTPCSAPAVPSGSTFRCEFSAGSPILISRTRRNQGNGQTAPADTLAGASSFISIPPLAPLSYR